MTWDKKKNEESKEGGSAKKLIAKKDWLIVQNDVRIEIKEGDEVNVPEKFLQTLITEKVI